jgi:hypothetical protein
MGDRLPVSEDLVVEVCREIVFHYEEMGREVVFHFLGGEPTLGPGLEKIGRRLSNYPVKISLRTNGSADIKWWEQARESLAEVIISVHRGFAKLSHIEQVIETLQHEDNFTKTNVKVLIPTDHTFNHWNWALKVRGHLQKKYGLGDLQLLYSNFGKGSNMYYPYSQEQLNQYYSLYTETPQLTLKANHDLGGHVRDGKSSLVYKSQPDFFGYICYAGIDTLTIDHFGRVWRGWCEQDGPIGSIYELPIEFPKFPIVCQKHKCHNGFDQLARKEITSSS